MSRWTARVLAAWLIDRVPRDHRETDAAFRHRRRVVGAVSVAGAGLLGMSLSTRPDSPEFYGLTLGVAATWAGGSAASGPLHLGWMPAGSTYRRPVVVPVIVGVGAFAAFYGAALAARRLPRLRRAVASVLRYAEQGNGPLVLLTTLANGAAEEMFFRGALYAAAGARYPVAKSTAVYALATAATRNPALVLASVPMGVLFALQRRATGGIEAPLLTHVTWSTLMLRYLPRLFDEIRAEQTGPWSAAGSGPEPA